MSVARAEAAEARMAFTAAEQHYGCLCQFIWLGAKCLQIQFTYAEKNPKCKIAILKSWRKRGLAHVEFLNAFKFLKNVYCFAIGTQNGE